MKSKTLQVSFSRSWGRVMESEAISLLSMIYIKDQHERK